MIISTFTPPRRIFSVLMMALSLGFTSSVTAQTIPIDSMFTASTTIFPFQGIETITSLTASGFTNHTETIHFPDFTKSLRIYPSKNQVKTKNFAENKLWLFPNPAGDYVIAYYNLDDKFKNGEIALIDLKGNLLIRFPVKNSKDQMVIDLKAYPNGLYIISLKSGNQILDSKKISKGGYQCLQ